MTEALDNLGRKINSTNMSIGELKGLIGTLMKSKVGPAKPLASFGSKQPAGDGSFDYKPLVESFEKYVKGHAEEIREQAVLIEEIKSLISETNKSRSQKQPQESDQKDNKKETFSDKIANSLKSMFKKDSRQGEVISESTEGLYKVFSKKGSGYTHDIYCEKWLHQIYDTLSKIAEKIGVSDVVKASDIIKEVTSDTFVESARKNLDTVPKESSPSFESRTRSPVKESSREIFEDYLSSQDPFVFEIDSLRDALDLFRNIFSKKLSKNQETQWAGAWTTRIDDVIKYYKKEFKLGTSEALNLEQVLQDKRFKDIFNKMKLSPDLLDAPMEEQQEVILALIEAQSRELKKQGMIQRRNDQVSRRILKDQIAFLNSLEKSVFGFQILDRVIGGVVDKERQFTQDIRAAAYETAGVTKEFSKLQRTYEDIGKTASKTGFSRDKFQESFIRGLKSGVKDQKKLNSLVTAQLNTEKQIGVEAGSLGEQFIEYGNSFKFNEDQIAAVGRGIREVGRSSGVVGEKLKQAVDSSKQFVDQMKKAGTATSASVSNVIGLKAEFQKLGVDGDKVLSALSSTTGFFEADNQTLSLIAQATLPMGLIQEAQAGIIMQNKEMQKGMVVGFKDVANKMGIAGESVEDLRKSLSDLSDYEKMTLNLRMKAAFGVESNELINLIEGLENSSRTLSDKLMDLNKQKQKNLTLEERAKIMEEERGAKLSASLGVLTALSESAKDASNMSEALSRFSRRRKDFEEDIKALGYAWTSEKDVARSSMKSAISTLNEGLKKAGKKQLSIDSSRIEEALKDETKFRELTSELTSAENELSTALKTQNDPLTSMDQKLTEANDILRNISQSLISGAFNSMIGKAVIALLAISAGAASFYTAYESNVMSLGNLLARFKRFRDPSSDTAQETGGVLTKTFAWLKDLIFGPTVIRQAEEALPASSGPKATQEKGTLESVVSSVVGKAAPKDSESNCCDKLLEINNSMLGVLNKIAECVCAGAKEVSRTIQEKASADLRSGQESLTPVQKVEKATAKSAERTKRTPEEAAARKAMAQEIRNVRKEKKLNDMKYKEQIKEIRRGKIQDQNIKQANAPKIAGIDLNELMSNGRQMAQTAAGILVLSAGAVALAAAIVFLSGKILDAFNLDAAKIVQTATAVGALAAAGAAIAAAGYGAYKLLTGDQEVAKFPKISELFSSKLMSTVGALLILGPALVLLGATIVKLAQMIVNSFGLDLTTVAETAGTVAAVVGAAGAITLAASEALEGFEKLSENDLLKNPGKIVDQIWKGAKTLLILGPGLVLLGAAVVKFSQIILGMLGLDAATIGKVAGRVAALIAATGVIAGAMVGALAGLAGLGMLAEWAKPFEKYMWSGAAALMLLTPTIVLLAAALNRIVGGILGIMGVDAGKAAKVAFDVAALIASTGVIAVAIIGAMAGLAGLGAAFSWAFFTGPFAAVAAGLMVLGAAALMLLTPPIIMLASALVNMIKGVLATREMDASTAAKTAYQVAGIIGAAGAIALSVMAAMAGLSGLGVLSVMHWEWSGMMILGAAALYALTPVVLSLASSIINMAGSIAGTLISPDEIKKITDGVSSILGGAAKIAISVLASVAGLSILGLFFASAMLAIPLMWLGTRAFNALIGPIVGFIGAVREASNRIGTVINPSEAESMSKGIATILQSIGDITKNIASASTSLASMPVYGSFWSWLMGSKIADRMWNGVKALNHLMFPIMAYVLSIKFFSRVVGKMIDPREAKSMGEGVSSILQSCATVTEAIYKAAKPLSEMKKYTGVFDWLRGGIAGMVSKGVDALNALSAPIRKYVAAIKDFSSQVGGILSPRMAAEMAAGVGDILCAVGGVSKIILQSKEDLSSIKYKEWGWFGTNYVSQMNAGVFALDKMTEPVISYISVIKRFSKRLGKKLSPRAAASMAEGVAEIISATGEVTKRVLETKEELSKIKTSTGWGWFRKDYVRKSREGVKALKELGAPIINYVDTIKNFSSEVGRKLDVRQAASMARGVAEILEASGDVTDKIVSTKDKLMKIKSSEGFWLWATNIPASMNKGVKALGELKQPIIDYVGSITDFSKEVGNKVKPQDAKSAVKGLSQVAAVVEVFSCVLNDLKDKINPLTQSGWFVDSPIEQMANAKKEMDKFFPTLSEFINSMIQNVNKSFKDVGELRSTVKNLGSISQIFQKVGETIGVFKERIVPLTQSGWFSSSDVDVIKESIPKFNGFFQSISRFITEGIVAPVSNIDDGSKLRDSAKKMVGVAQLLQEASCSMASMHSMIELTSDGFFSSSPMKNISDNKDKFAQYFAGISAFIDSGIIDPVKKITNSEGLIEAGAKLKDIGCFIYGIKLVLENLSGVFSLMESKSIFEKAPLEKIEVNKDQFSKYLESAKNFVLSGLLAPSLDLPSKEISIASGNLKTLSVMLSSVPVVIKELASSVSLATDKDDFFGDAPMEKIIKSKDIFSKWFAETAAFVRDGIALPVKKEFEGIDLVASAKIMGSMASIASAITPIIKNLSSIMGMMSGETEDRLDSDFPIDKILQYKNLFADYFKKISIFLRDGIAAPVKEIFPDIKGIREASSTLSAMNNIVGIVPRLILGMSKNFIPLVEGSQDLSKDVPMEAIVRSKDQFATWFVQIAHFLKDGIVDPINNVIGDPKDIQKAGRTLSAMNGVVSSITNIIKNLSTMFGGLNEKKCLQGSPAEFIASQTEKFAGWFYSIISFLKVGIINPVNQLVPDAKEMNGVREKLRTLTASMGSIPEMFDELGGSISMFSQGFLWRIITGFKISKLSKNFISMANIINEGIVKPIQKFLPSSDELNEVNNQLNEFIMIIEKIASTMGMAGKAFLGIKPADLEGLVSMKKGIQKISDPNVFEAEVQTAIRGRTEMAINAAEHHAEAAAIAALSKKTGRTDLSGVEVDTQVDMEKRIVKAVAKWSKEQHDDALGVKAVNDGINAGSGGPGRSNLPVVPTPAPQRDPAQAATKSLGAKKAPIVVEGTDTYNFNDPVDKQLAMEAAQQNAKELILEKVQKLAGKNAGMFRSTGSLEGVTYRDAKYSWDEKEQEGIARIIAEYAPKFAEGGVVNKATLGVIGEAGPEAVVPLSGIEKYSSGIIKGLDKINTSLVKMLDVLKGGKGTSTAVEIGENAIGVSIGMALAPAVSNIPSTFKQSANYIASVFNNVAKEIISFIKDQSGSAFESLSSTAESVYSTLEPYSDQIQSYAKTAFDYVKGKIPQSVKDYASGAFDNIKQYGLKAFKKTYELGNTAWKKIRTFSLKTFSKVSEYAGPVWEKVKEYGSQAFSTMSGAAGPAFEKIKSFGSKAFKDIPGMASSAWSNLKSFGSKAFSSISTMAGPVWDSLKSYGTQAFSKIYEFGGSLKTYASQAFSKISENAGPVWEKVKSYATQAFEKMGPVWEKVKSYATQAFEKMGPVWEKVKSYATQAFSKVSSTISGLMGGKPVSEIASKAFSSIKEYGKAGFSKLASLFGGGAKGAASSLGGAAKGLLSKAPAGGAMAPVENVKKVGDAGSSVKGNFESVKEALKNLAEGIKSFANKEAFLGALNLIPTGIGLTAMIPGFLGAKLVEKIDGKKVEESLGGLSRGISMMASGKVLLGAGAILLASIGLLGLLPALPGLAILGAISGLVTSGLTALSTGLTTFGTAAANPMFWLGILGIAALGAALIPLGYALSTLSPLITAFGDAVGTVLGGIAGVINSVAMGMTMFLSQVSLEKAAGLMGIAGGLLALSGAMVLFAVASAASGWVSFFGGESTTIKSIMKLADAGPNLNLFAQSLLVITEALSGFGESLSNVDSMESSIKKLVSMATELAVVAPLLQSLNQVSGLASSPEGVAEKFNAPGMIKHVDEAVSGKNLSYGSIKESYLDRVNGPGLQGAVPNQVSSTGGSPSTNVPATVSTASPTAANRANIEQKLMKDKAALEPAKSEIVSPELGALTTETEEQTEILTEMRDLFEKFLEMLKPKDQANKSSGGDPGSTLPQNVVGKPTNYYRRVAGNIGQTPGRATLNLGAKAVS